MGKYTDRFDIWGLTKPAYSLLDIPFYHFRTSNVSFSIWPQAKPLLEKKDIKKLVDPSLGDEYDQDELNRLTSTASLCIEQSSLLRPRMSQVQWYKLSIALSVNSFDSFLFGYSNLKNVCQVVESLLGQESCVVTPREDNRKMMQRTYSEELLDSIEYNSTRHLRDLDRIREVALASWKLNNAIMYVCTASIDSI